MSDDVAAVLVQALFNAKCGGSSGMDDLLASISTDDALVCLKALAAAGYAVVKLPEGVEVAHGTRLKPHRGAGGVWACFAIEATP